MPTTDQALGCSKGDTYAFEIDMVANTGEAAPDLSGATAVWALTESWFEGAKTYLTKVSGSGVFVNLDAGVWKVIVALDPADTANVSPGLLWHKAIVTLSDGSISHIASGPFVLDPI